MDVFYVNTNVNIYQSMDLHKYLRMNKIRQVDFAKEVGITQKTLYMLMMGKMDPRLSLIRKIEIATNNEVTGADLLSKEEKSM